MKFQGLLGLSSGGTDLYPFVPDEEAMAVVIWRVEVDIVHRPFSIGKPVVARGDGSGLSQFSGSHDRSGTPIWCQDSSAQ